MHRCRRIELGPDRRHLRQNLFERSGQGVGRVYRRRHEARIDVGNHELERIGHVPQRDTAVSYQRQVAEFGRE